MLVRKPKNYHRSQPGAVADEQLKRPYIRKPQTYRRRKRGAANGMHECIPYGNEPGNPVGSGFIRSANPKPTTAVNRVR